MNAFGLINSIGILGVIVFAASGAAAANRHRLDPIGFILIGTLTAIGGGTLRDVLLNQPVFWISAPFQLVCAIVASLSFYFYYLSTSSRKKCVTWLDAAGLAAFTVQGCFVALFLKNHYIVVIVMGVLTAVGGGIIRDILTGDQPMILKGQLYASTALLGSIVIILANSIGISNGVSAIFGFLIVFLSRATTIIFDIRMGPPGQFLKIGKEK